MRLSINIYMIYIYARLEIGSTEWNETFICISKIRWMIDSTLYLLCCIYIYIYILRSRSVLVFFTIDHHGRYHVVFPHCGHRWCLFRRVSNPWQFALCDCRHEIRLAGTPWRRYFGHAFNAVGIIYIYMGVGVNRLIRTRHNSVDITTQSFLRRMFLKNISGERIILSMFPSFHSTIHVDFHVKNWKTCISVQMIEEFYKSESIT